MNTVIIEVPKFMDVTIKAQDIPEAVRKLLKLRVAQKQKVSVSIQRFKGIAKFNMSITEEEWYRQ